MNLIFDSSRSGFFCSVKSDIPKKSTQINKSGDFSGAKSKTIAAGILIFGLGAAGWCLSGRCSFKINSFDIKNFLIDKSGGCFGNEVTSLESVDSENSQQQTSMVLGGVGKDSYEKDFKKALAKIESSSASEREKGYFLLTDLVELNYRCSDAFEIAKKATESKKIQDIYLLGMFLFETLYKKCNLDLNQLAGNIRLELKYLMNNAN